MDNKDFIPLRHVELIQTCDVESNKLDSVSSVSSQAYDTSNMLNSYRDEPENTETPELNIEKEEESDDGFILPGRPNDEDEEIALSVKDNGLLIDIYNIERFAKKCKKAYDNFQIENANLV